MSTKLIEKHKFTAKMELLTGLHIGAANERVEIGGIDKTVVRNPIDGLPYIPGSSLKGKIRSLLEVLRGVSEVGGDEGVNKIFGIAKRIKDSEHQTTIRSKLIFRDAKLTKNSIERIEKKQHQLDLYGTEIKFENSIKRVEGTAEHPRKIERIPAGLEFDVEIILNVYEESANLEEMKALLEEGLSVLENDYLGGNGSRGYGQVIFKDKKYEKVFPKS